MPDSEQMNGVWGLLAPAGSRGRAPGLDFSNRIFSFLLSELRNPLRSRLWGFAPVGPAHGFSAARRHCSWRALARRMAPSTRGRSVGLTTNTPLASASRRRAGQDDLPCQRADDGVSLNAFFGRIDHHGAQVRHSVVHHEQVQVDAALRRAHLDVGVFPWAAAPANPPGAGYCRVKFVTSFRESECGQCAGSAARRRQRSALCQAAAPAAAAPTTIANKTKMNTTARAPPSCGDPRGFCFFAQPKVECAQRRWGLGPTGPSLVQGQSPWPSFCYAPPMKSIFPNARPLCRRIA